MMTNNKLARMYYMDTLAQCYGPDPADVALCVLHILTHRRTVHPWALDAHLHTRYTPTYG